MDSIGFVKGHGTENDFVVLTDPDGELELSPTRVRALCDRRRGLGADGVLRIVRAGALGSPAPEGIAGDDWFMDYRNGDGSVAEMCGNGVRVVAHHLHDAGLERRPEFVVGSRSGPRPVVVHAAGAIGDVTVDMGATRTGGTSRARVDGRERTGLVVDVGNPHLACVGLSDPELAALDLSSPPELDAEVFPDGANVELVTPVHDGAVSMRVFERGVGETRSCGTGIVATAVAALASVEASTGRLGVRVPGGCVDVEVTAGTTYLRGPSELVARGVLDPHWWERHA